MTRQCNAQSEEKSQTVDWPVTGELTDIPAAHKSVSTNREAPGHYRLSWAHAKQLQSRVRISGMS